MATTQQINNFISKIAPLIQKQTEERGYLVVSSIIAQACLESGYGTSILGYKYHNYFGMKCGSSWKGKSVNLDTREEYNIGQITDIKANFRVYDNMENGVAGYFNFISSSRYANLKTAKTPKEYLELIKSDGYATSSTYVALNMTIVDKYNLTKYDTLNSTPNAIESITVIAGTLNCRSGVSTKDPILGAFSNGTKLTVLEKTTSSWYKVKGKATNGKVITGYCSTSYLAKSTITVANVKTFLNCRPTAGVKGNPIGKFINGNVLELLEKTNNTWYKVRGCTVEGKIVTGYCSTSYLV